MINIVEFALNIYPIYASANSNPISDPDHLLDTLAGEPTLETGDHTWDRVFQIILNLGNTPKRIYFPASYTCTTALDPAPDPATYTKYPILNTLNIDRPVIISGDGGRSTIIEYANETVLSPAIRVLATGVTMEHFKVRRSNTGQMEHGILLSEPASIKQLYVELALSDGIHIEETANGCHLYYVKLYNNARYGFFTAASNGVSIALDVNANLEGAVIDQSKSGNNYYGCHTAGIESGPQPISYQAKNGLFLGCYAEFNQLSPKIDKPGIWIGAESEIPVGSGTIWKDQTFYIQDKNRGIRFENRTGGSIVDFTAGGALKGIIFEFGANEDFQTGLFPFERLDNADLDERQISTVRSRFDLYRQLEELIDQRQQLIERLEQTSDEEELAEIKILLGNNQSRKNSVNFEISTVEESIKDIPIGSLDDVLFGRWRLEYTPDQAGAYSNWYRLRYYAQPMLNDPESVLVPAEVSTGMAFSSTVANTTDNGSGHRLLGYVAFPRGFFIGSGVNRIKIGISDIAPENPTKIGDIIFNSNPAVGSPAGWVCADVGSGTAWRTFGIVEE
ncbi:MAG: hypothetical protein IPM47_19775 [Sphingobacteriales bacterium]|nr:MAG: hypothetical protein IPM47_19775 [Sphingobacteriales bacterium]